MSLRKFSYTETKYYDKCISCGFHHLDKKHRMRFCVYDDARKVIHDAELFDDFPPWCPLEEVKE